MRRQREEDARFVEHELAVGVGRDGSELQRDEPVVLEVEGLHEAAFSALAHDLERLVAVMYELGHLRDLILIMAGD